MARSRDTATVVVALNVGQRTRRLVAIVALAVALSGCSEAQVLWWANASTDGRATAVEHVVRSAADEYGVDPDLMLSIQRCEGSVPWAYNRSSGAAGLYQHLLRYWPGRAAAVGAPDAPWYDPVTNARAAAWMLANQGTTPWRASAYCW